MFDWLRELYHFLARPEIEQDLLSAFTMIIVCVVGVAFTIFSVIHSFIESRRALVKSYEQQMRVESVNPFVSSEIKFGKKYIANMRRINIGFFVVIVTSVVMLLLTIVESLFHVGRIYYMLVFFFNMLYLGGIIIMLTWYMVLYFKTTRRVKVK